MSRTRRWALVGLSIVAYYALFQSFYNLVAEKKLFPYQDAHEVLLAVTLNITPIIVLVALTWVVVFRPSKLSIRSKMVVDALLCVLMLVGYNLLYVVVLRAIGLGQYAGVDWPGTGFNSVLIYLAMEVAYYITNYRQQQIVIEEQKMLALQYQYDALKAQVNPHFLFNSLNILYSLVTVDVQKSQDFIVALSQMYRYVLSQQNRSRIKLRDELEFLDTYVSVLKMRYSDSLDMEIKGGELVNGQEIIPFTLQLLMENVTKHNVISTRYPMTVKVEIGKNGLTVSNPIRVRVSSTESSQIGLRYIKKQYEIHQKQFEVENDGTTFTAKIPYI